MPIRKADGKVKGNSMRSNVLEENLAAA